MKAPHPNVAVRCQHLSCTYPGATAPALCDLTFALAPGTLHCLAGPNGSGKSTLLLVLAGLLRPPGNEDAVMTCGPVALLPHDPDAWLLGDTVLEDLWLGLGPQDHNQRQRAVDLARRFGLEGLFEARTQSLSFGQKRKLCLASALASDPPILLLDEPLTGLDYPAIRELRAILAQEKAAGRTILLSSHDMEPLADLADGVVLLNGGKLIAHGSVIATLPFFENCGVRPPCSWQRERQVAPWA